MLRLRRLRRFKPIYGAVLVMVLWTTGSGALWFLLPGIVESFFSDLKVVGLVIALPSIISLLIDLPAGDLVDRIGRKRVLLFTLCALAVLGLCLIKVSTPIHLLLFMAGLGLVYQLVYISMLAYLMDVSPKGDYSTVLGTEMSFIHLGFSIGAIAAGMALAYLSIGSLVAASVIYSLFCVLALVTAVYHLRPDKEKAGLAESVKSILIKDKLFVKELLDYGKLKKTGLVVLGLTFLLTFYDGVVWLIQPLYYTRFSTNPLYGATIMAAFVLPLVLFEVPAGFLADRIGRKKVLVLGLSCAGLFSILFSLAGSFIPMITTAFLATCGLALAWPSTEGILSSKAPKSERGEVAGVWSLAYDMGYVAGPIIAGFIASYLGGGGAFFAMGVLLIFAALTSIAIKD